MPIYEYRRPDGTTFEVVQKFSDDALTHDPETGVEVQRVLHAPAIHFKGSGFHNTDYGTKKRQREEKANKASSSEGGSSSESKSESKTSDSSSSSSSSSDKKTDGGGKKAA
jgi:putative FmdB family regulatory protein